MVDLAPEWLKEAQGQQRYERLIGAADGLGMNLDVAKALIETYTPPRGHSYQLPTKEELRRELKKTMEAFDAYRRKVRHFEAELIAAEWQVK